MRTAVVSNWDIRLRPLLVGLGAASAFDAIVVSGEELIEKPDPRIFAIACRRLGVAPENALHVGDSPIDDVEGAKGAGCQALLLGRDVKDFEELTRQLLSSIT
jgi:HAD superfamily hydrolase (TIGR01549 family)